MQAAPHGRSAWPAAGQAQTTPRGTTPRGTTPRQRLSQKVSDILTSGVCHAAMDVVSLPGWPAAAFPTLTMRPIDATAPPPVPLALPPALPRVLTIVGRRTTAAEDASMRLDASDTGVRAAAADVGVQRAASGAGAGGAATVPTSPNPRAARPPWTRASPFIFTCFRGTGSRAAAPLPQRQAGSRRRSLLAFCALRPAVLPALATI
jgi:hypothetical protein